jgi:gamma-glutamyltranspeptidase/glutathione hydrolase
VTPSDPGAPPAARASGCSRLAALGPSDPPAAAVRIPGAARGRGAAAIVVLLALPCLLAWGGRARVAGAVAADHPLASEAGAEMLRRGGNAVDAAVAAALSSGVVQPSGSGLGGGGFAVVVGPGAGGAQVVTALDFRETAPGAATRDSFAPDPQGKAPSSTEGGLAVATPSEAFGLLELHDRYGRLPLRAVVAPAIRQAERGVAPGPHLSASLAKVDAEGCAATGSCLADRLFARPSAGKTPSGVWRRPALGKALRALVATHGQAFRDGWVAQDVVDAVRAAGGVLTREDLRAYRVRELAPLRGSYGARTVVTMPPPSSGGVALLQLLAVAADGVPCEVEAAKHVMAERAAMGGDASPEVLAARLDPARVAAIRADCVPGGAAAARTQPPSHYAPPRDPPRDAGTLHISAMDGDGWAVALTTTINTSFGSRVVAPRSGILLNNQMDDFATRPGQPNAFGLVQGEENAIAPGKRPLSSMTPAVVLDAAGRPEVVAGASGGPFIITATYQTLRAVLDGRMAPRTAVFVPRWHHQWLPDTLVLEPNHPMRAALEARGHVVREAPGFSAVQIVQRRLDGTFDAASDPRKHGSPAIVAAQ